ncbi:hypothetical protein protein [Bacillus cereus G9241]|nr:hypothetical protein protein [Bacillus cereus G9241]
MNILLVECPFLAKSMNVKEKLYTTGKTTLL